MEIVKVKIISSTGNNLGEGELHVSSGIIRFKEIQDGKKRTVWLAVDHLCHRGNKVVELEPEPEVAPEPIKEDPAEEVYIPTRADALKLEIATLEEKKLRLNNKEKKLLKELKAELATLGEPKSEESQS